MVDLSDQQLKDELAQRLLDKEQQMLMEPYSTVKVVGGAVGSNLLFNISVAKIGQMLILLNLVPPNKSVLKVSSHDYIPFSVA